MDQREHFNKTYESWIRSIDDNKRSIIEAFLARIKVVEGESIADVGCGTGVLYPFLVKKDIKYSGFDISDKMLEAFQGQYDNVNLARLDFDQPVECIGVFNQLIIFNSIPHFEHMEIVFNNAREALKRGGRFTIVHARSREGLRMHHKKIGHVPRFVPIASDETLKKLCVDFGFKLDILEDEKYFFFSAIKK